MDVGNTRTKYVTVKGDQRSSTSYCENEHITASWLTLNFPQATEFILANVNNENFTKLIERWTDNAGIDFQLLKTKSQQFELKCAYQNPSQLGIDRWLAMLGANLLFPKKNCLVVDAGTATTIDVISDQGQHLGGWILPGIDMLYQSLVTNTQKIIAEKSDRPSVALGKTTSECVNNATWAITVGTIELQLEKMKKQQVELEILITGGNCTQISSLLKDTHHLIDDLIFIGMQRFRR